MKLPGESVVIDLDAVSCVDQLFDVLGTTLELGGPDSNSPVQQNVEGTGCGQNWNALADSLLCLDSGGIWGTRRRFNFPFSIEFQNASNFRTADPEGYATLCEVLDETRECYAEHDLEFRFTFN